MKQFILLGLIALASSGSQDAIVYYGRGLAKSTKGDQDGAIADFSKAIDLNPKLAEAYLNRGLAKSTRETRTGPSPMRDKPSNSIQNLPQHT
jgi:hypothetical protein